MVERLLNLTIEFLENDVSKKALRKTQLLAHSEDE